MVTRSVKSSGLLRGVGLAGAVALSLSLLGGCAAPLLGFVKQTENKPADSTAEVAAEEAKSPSDQTPRGFRDDDVALASDAALSSSTATSSQIQTESIEIPTVPNPLGDGPVSIAQVFSYAREYHPQLRAKAQEIDLARAERLGAGLFANPQLVMDAMGPVDGDDNASLTTRVDFTVPIGGKRQRGMSAAAAAEERARLELAYDTDLVLLEVSDAAATVLYLQELAGLQQEISDINARFAKMQDERAAQNVITDVDRLLAETSAKEAEFERLSTEVTLEQARLLLAQAMGMTQPRPLVLSGVLETPRVPPAPLPEILAAARKVRPELRAGDWGIREQQRRVDLARAEGIPDITISPRYSEAFNDSDDAMGARFTSDLLLWNWNQGAIAEAMASTREARANRQLYESTTLGDVAQAYVSLAPLQRQLDYYDSQVAPAMGQAIAGIEKAFQVQAIDAAELSQQLTRLAKLRREHLEIRYAHQQTRMRLEILLRRPLASFAAEPIPAGVPAPAELPPDNLQP